MSKKKNKASDDKSVSLEKENNAVLNESDDSVDTETETILTKEEKSSEAVASDSESLKKTDEKESDTSKSDKSSDKKEKKEKKIDPVKEKKKAAKKDKRELKKRAFVRGWFSVALVAFFIAGVIVLNMIASTLVEKIPALTFDTTGSDNFELTEETIDYLGNLEDKIKIYVLSEEKEFKEGGEYFIQVDTLLHRYTEKSDNISLEFVDMTTDPTFTSRYPDESLGYYNIIVQNESKDSYKYVTQSDYLDIQFDYTSYSQYIAGSKIEEAITSAILNVTLEDKPKVTFISDINNNDYSYFKSYLENNGFETEEVSPATNNIPEDTKILVLYTPVSDLDSSYVDMISDFLANDGSYGKELLYFPSEKMLDLPNIESLIEEWGISVDKGYAIENDTGYMGQISYGVYLYITQYSDQTYSSKMKNPDLPFCVVGGYTCPVEILDDSNVTSLFKLSEQSQVLYPVESSDEPEEVNLPNLDVGAIATKSASDSSDDSSPSSNVVVIGSSVSCSESIMGSTMYGNGTYMLALLNTLCDRDNVGVSIQSTSLESAQLGITTAQIRVLSLIFIFIVPVAVLITGIVIFVKRRNM